MEFSVTRNWKALTDMDLQQGWIPGQGTYPGIEFDPGKRACGRQPIKYYQ